MLQAAVAATAYLIVARERLAFVIQPDGVAALWQPAEIALATLRLSGHRALPSILASIARRRRRGTFQRPSALLGEHTGEVLAELGLARADIERLAAAGVVAFG